MKLIDSTTIMEDQIPTFLAVTGIEDVAVAKQYLELTNGDLDYAVTLFMEGGAHPHSTATPSNDDEELAQRLQNEAYSDNNVREADANVHRHETLVDSFGDPFGFMPPPHSRPNDMFGSARVGIFNQRYDSDEDEYYRNRVEEIDDDEYDDDVEYPDDEEDEDDNDVIIIDSDEEGSPRVPMSRRRRTRASRQEELTSTQRRLANLFRPPFDIISKLSIDAAKVQCKQENKWLLINIQDTTEFQSQVLNRDFWSNGRVKQIVRDNFIFLQYQNDSPNGVSYLNFYHADAFPHIAILDPLTGERVFKWTDGVVPQVDEWEDDVHDFLSKFSLHPDSSNPVVKHEPKFDPDALTEEQQIELALKQSMNNADESAAEQEPEPEPEKQLDPFEAIVPTDHPEPTSGDITRIQIRFPNGKRLVHKFSLTDTILTLFQWLKFVLNNHPEEYGILGQEAFTITNTSDRSFKFIESLDATVGDANLKNASLLLEKQ